MTGDSPGSEVDQRGEQAVEAPAPQGLRLRAPNFARQANGVGAEDMFEVDPGYEHGHAAVNIHDGWDRE